MENVHPRLIQGGMGIGVSDWRLANAVSRAGHLGTVSGTGLWLVMSRRLQLGDLDGSVRRALAHFPSAETVDHILTRYYIPGGKHNDQPFRNPPMISHPLKKPVADLMVAANFVEVWLAKEGHNGRVAVNYLEKIQLSHLPSLYGAMLAGVDYVLMGAGIPIQIAEALDRLAAHLPASYRLTVEGAGPEDVYEERFDPFSIPLDRRPEVNRPFFFPIISSNVLAQVLLKRSTGRIDGFIVEGHTAGGHNAPPRNRKDTDASGNPTYGEQDQVDLEKLKSTGLPFWLAGSFAGPESIQAALRAGASGVQVGSIFALCDESGLRQDLKQEAIKRAVRGDLRVVTNFACSPSGYPFKEADIPGTLTDPSVARHRLENCDIGALRTLYKMENGKVGYRCPAEPVDAYVRKGGQLEDSEGRRCLCNTLCASIGLGQVRPKLGYTEPPLVTLGSDLSFLSTLGALGSYTCNQAVEYLNAEPSQNQKAAALG